MANGTDPEFAPLPEADRSDMTYFLEQLRLVLPILGFDLFRSLQASANQPGEGDAQSPIFDLDSVGVTASGRETDQGFIVLAGSTARKIATASFPQGYRGMRDQLVAEAKLVEGPVPDSYRFAADVAFPSPSAAATIVKAASASGPQDWKQRGSGLSYREWHQNQLID